MTTYRLWCERSLPAEYATFLGGEAAVVGAASETPQSPLAALPGAEGIIAGARIRYDGTLMDLSPALRVISRSGIGVDNVSIPAATERGIVVCNAPDAPTVSTAEMAITLMLAMARDLKRIQYNGPRADESDVFGADRGIELAGCQLGLVGLGRIGGRVSGVARALGMRVVAYDPYVEPAQAQVLNVRLEPQLETVLQLSDIVSLHAPLNDETRGLINAERLAAMKPGAILINTARGGLVDEAALVDALDSGPLRGAGLDVLGQEPPPPDHPLLGRGDVILTPHIASATAASKKRLWRTAIEQALQVLRGERPPHLVNPEVWEKRRPAANS